MRSVCLLAVHAYPAAEIRTSAIAEAVAVATLIASLTEMDFKGVLQHMQDAT